MDLERSILKIIRGEKKAPVAMACLKAFSLAYRSAIALKNLAYDKKILSSEKLSVPVVSIGNLVAGGTGKTPLVHSLALALQNKVRLGILSRGYKSQIEKSKQIKQISEGDGPLCSPTECGDEPYFLAQKTKASFWVGADRIASGKKAIEQGVNCLLLDDGMQHRRLFRDFEIVVIDGTNPFSEGNFLPRGWLRDSPKRLKNADLIVATHVKDATHFKQLQALISHFSDAPLIGTQVEVLNRERFVPRKVGVFCGIGQPSRFLQTARDLNQEIVDTLILKDHAPLQKGQLEKFAKNCFEKGARALLCTEKDYVKLSRNDSSLDIHPVEIALKIIHGREHWEKLIDNILDKAIK